MEDERYKSRKESRKSIGLTEHLYMSASFFVFFSAVYNLIFKN